MFCSDAVFDFTESSVREDGVGHTWTGADNFVAAMKVTPAYPSTINHGFPPEIDIESPTDARAI